MPAGALEPIKLASVTTNGHALVELVIFARLHRHLIKCVATLKDNGVDLHSRLLQLLMPMIFVVMVIYDALRVVNELCVLLQTVHRRT